MARPVKFEDKNGGTVWINPDHVTCITPYFADMTNYWFGHGGGTVKGTPEEVIAKLWPEQEGRGDE